MTAQPAAGARGARCCAAELAATGAVARRPRSPRLPPAPTTGKTSMTSAIRTGSALALLSFSLLAQSPAATDADAAALAAALDRFGTEVMAHQPAGNLC